MIRATLLFLFLLSLIAPAPLRAQASLPDGREAIAKILQPLPDYDPFSHRSSPAPEYFPDDTEKRVRQVLIDSLTNPNKDLEDAVHFFREKDAELSKERHTVTGLTDHVLDLHLNSLSKRSDYLEAQEKALALASTEQQKKLIQSRINHDELRQANEYLRKSKTNRWGAMANSLLSSVDLMEIAAGSYLSAAVDTTFSQVAALREPKMSTGERKALAMYRRYLRRYPQDPGRKKIEKLIEALERKKRELLVHKYLKAGREAEETGEYTRAELQFTMASLINPEAKEAGKELDELAALRRRENKEKRGKALFPEPPPGEVSDTQFDGDFVDLLYDLTLRSPEGVEAHARALATRNEGNALGDSSQDALAVAMEMRGRHEAAKKLLRRLSRSSASPNHRNKAKALLESPDYDQLSQVHAAQTKHRMETIQYVLLGENFLEKNLFMGARPLVVQGLAGLNTWGIANVLIMGSNLYQVLTAHPVSDQDIIDKAVAYIRSHPHAESTTEVYNLLAEAYEKRGTYDKAIAYYEMAGTASKDKIAALNETAAESLLDRAAESPSKGAKEFYLRAILEFYPGSAASKQAKGKLAALLKPENRGARISKQFLMENPGLAMEGGLGLKSSLFDGEASNVELAVQGINFLSANEILFHFETPWGVQSRTYPVRPETIRHFESALRKRNYEVALEDVHTRPNGSPGGIGNLPLRLPREHGGGNVDGDGADIALVKRAAAPNPAHPSELNYELLSESEKNDGVAFRLPRFQGSVSSSSFNITGDIPASLWGEQLSLGSDGQSPFAGLKLPIPLLQDFIPVDFLLRARPGGPSLIPQIHRFQDNDDSALFR